MASVQQQTLAETASTQATTNGTPTKSFVRPGKSAFSDSPDARSKTMIHLDGPNTFGLLNHIPSTHTSYTIGVSEDKGARRTMEDAHSFVIDFAGIKGQGYFAVFDGHAGKHAAEWCGQHFHEYLLDGLATGGDALIPDILAKTFLRVDKELSRMSDDGTTHSGCTAATCFLRLESNDGKQPFAPPFDTLHPPSSSAISISSSSSDKDKGSESPRSGSSSTFTRKIKDKLSGNRKTASQDGPALTSAPLERGPPAVEVEAAKRVLYTANVGDARAVLSRSGKAIRLTYDHKGSDKTEIKRIIDAGGFVMNNRVNGVLAVTRSLGDSAMKEFVVGSPYTTETEIVDDDEYVIIACDGLWDVCEDQQAVDLIKHCKTAQEASDLLLGHALSNFSNDNVSVLVIKFGSGSNVSESSAPGS